MGRKSKANGGVVQDDQNEEEDKYDQQNGKYKMIFRNKQFFNVPFFVIQILNKINMLLHHRRTLIKS